MFSQIGNIIFDGRTSFGTVSHSESVSYAEHALINGKPILVPTGNNLEEFNITMRFRAEFINPEAARLQIKEAKDKYEVLPYIKGNGQYMGDFVITEMSAETVQALTDGTPVEMTINVTLREYVSADKLAQQQNAAKKSAFAVGQKTPLSLGVEEPISHVQDAGEAITSADTAAADINVSVSEYGANVAQRPNLALKIEKLRAAMDASLLRASVVIADIPGLQGRANLLAAISVLRNRLSDFAGFASDIEILRSSNTGMQQAMRALNSSAGELLKLIITKAG